MNSQAEKEKVLQNPEAKEKLKFEDLTLFTGTFYDDTPSSRLRQSFALQLFEKAKENDIKIVVSDGGSNADFLEMAASYPNVTILQEPEGSTMGSSRRFALEQALDDAKNDPEHIFMWLEPEKIELADPTILTMLTQPIREGTADIVVPSRKNLDTLPKQQAWIETRANERASNIMKGKAPNELVDRTEPPLDLWFGPKVFNAQGAQYFAQYQGDLDKWDATIKPVLNAHKDGLRITNVPIDFNYPPSQSEYENGNIDFQRKRMQQYASILIELGDPFWKNHELISGAIKEK